MAISFKNDIAGFLAVTLLVVLMAYPILDGNHAIMSDSWRLHYPWAIEPDLPKEDADELFGGEGYRAQEPYIQSYDIYLENLPWYNFAQKELKAGRMPLWNPYSYSGAPLYANHLVPVTHPPLLIALLVAPPVMIHTVSIMLTWWIGGLGIYFYLRRKKKLPIACVGVTALYLTCGHYMPLVPFQMSGLMYYPWILMASDVIEDRKSFVGLTWFSILLALQLIAGHTAYVVPFIYLVFIHRILGWAFNRRPLGYWAPRLGLLVLGFILGAVMSLPQNVPTMNLLKLSARDIEGQTERTLFIGDATGNKVQSGEEKSIWSRALMVFSPIFEPQIEREHPYTGVPLILLAIFGLIFTRPPPERWSMLTLLGIFTILAFPPVFTRIAHLIPGLGISPYNPYATAQFILVILAGTGLDALLNVEYSLSKSGVRWMTVSCLIGLNLFVWPLIVSTANTNYDWVIRSVSGLFFLILLTGLVTIFFIPAAIIVKPEHKPGITRFLPLMLVISGITIFFYMNPIFQQLPVMPRTPSIDAIPISNEYRVIRHSSKELAYAGSVDNPLTFGGNLPMWAGWLDSQGYDSFVLERQWKLLRELDKKSIAWNGLAFPITDNSALQSPILDALAVKWLISDDPSLIDGPEGVLPDTDWNLLYEGGLVIYEKKNALPRWYLSDNPVYVAGFDEAANDLFILRTYPPGVVIETPLADRTGLIPFKNVEIDGEFTTGAITLINEIPTRLEFSVLAETDCWFVLSDTWHPGWSASVDGEKVEIYHANGAFRAVVVGEGSHDVVFEYEEPGLKMAAIWAFLVFLSLLTGNLIGLSMWRRTGDSGGVQGKPYK